MTARPRIPVSAWLAALACGGCARPETREPASRTWTAMGTFATLTVAAREAGQLDACAARMQAILRELEQSLSIYSPTSDVSRLNAAAGRGPVAVGPHARAALEASLRYGRISGGAFDVTVAPLVRLWGFSGGRRPDAPPPDAELRACRERIGYDHLRLSGGTAELMRAGMAVDLGGIAKGYAVDVCYEALRAGGAENFMVNLGGNVRAHGARDAGRPWRIGVRNPFDGSALLGTVELASGEAVATSGNYERFVEIAGRRYAHIIDPRTGRPVEGMAGVTVLAATALETDAMSTALFVLGPAAGAAALAGLPGCEAIWVPDVCPPSLTVTGGFRRRFAPLPDFARAVREWPGALQSK